MQRQLDSEVAGLAFSLDPVSNDFDRVVVDAAWGLGERVVSGAVSPDHFVVDKVAGEVITRTVGTKGPALRVAPGGGLHEVDGAAGLCLSDARVVELAHLVARVEALFGMPVEVEWAVGNGALHVLQARPITTWVPLPASMQTKPGAPAGSTWTSARPAA